MCEHGTCVICANSREEVEFADPYPEIVPDDEPAGTVFVSEEERMHVVEHLFRSETHTWSTVKAIAVIAGGRAMTDDEVEAMAKSLRIRVVRPVLEPELVDEIEAHLGKTLTDVPLPS